MEWSSVVLQYVGFVSSFLMLGAVGFRYGVVRASGSTVSAPLVGPLASGLARAGGLGLLGVVLGVATFVESLLSRAEAKHLSIGDVISAGGSTTIAQIVLLVVLLIAFALAWRRTAIGWPVAGVAALALALRNLLNGKITSMVNPLHIIGASLWLGTLFVLIVCGVAPLQRAQLEVADREQMVAHMVRRFSTVALASASLLGVTGVITAWTHLNPLDALWTTSYGYALLAKLGVVAIVVGLGAWNWRRVGPALGNDGGARTIRRTASLELAFASVVLAITAVLVSLPSPHPPAH